ncbi:MAG TPA: primosomal protein N', partial [Balneolales bacterium]|nr:primosomal protein N' [Balneolales bacterium]
NCGDHSVVEKGSGTQQIEEDISKLFPEARLLRMDQDTTSGKNAHARILNKFGRREADILIGTQIVAKGLDFPEVTVVGVINSDTELAFPSYRSSERMFQLLSQVAGRSGRSLKKGIVYFQTWQPDHIAIICARKHDYDRFAEVEMEQRKQLSYPPFSRILQINFKSKDGTAVHKVAHIFSECLIKAGNNAPVLGPSPSAVIRVYNEYRWECLLKISPTNGAKVIEHLLNNAFQFYDSRKPRGASKVRITVNVDAL